LTNTFTVKRKVDTLLKIGLLYEEAKDYQQAQRSYEAALSHDEGNFKIYQHLAWSYYLQGNINQAIEFVRKAEKKNKAQSDSSYILGRCYMGLENNKDALENFQQAAYKNPGEAVYWATLAIFYYNTGNYTDAFENIIKATTLNPQMSEVWYNLGVLYEKCRQPEEALIAYSKVLELDSDEADAQARIMAIKSPQYALEQQKQPQVTLQMKYPKFALPNSLMILRKYKKQQQ
jgi:general transcriptional corepressor CYC8